MGGPGQPAAWRDWARQVEAWGYSTLTVNDHLGPFGPADALVAPLLSLTLAATVTTTLRLAALVMNFDLCRAVWAAVSARTYASCSASTPRPPSSYRLSDRKYRCHRFFKRLPAQ